MSEQQTYKAKGTSLVVLLLILIAGWGNKACKSIYLPPKLSPAAAPVVKHPAKESSSKPSKSISSKTKNSKKEEVATRQDSVRKKTNYSYPTAFQRNFSLPAAKDSGSVEKIIIPHLSVLGDETEIAALEKELGAVDNIIFQAGKKRVDTTLKQKTAADNGRVTHTTG